MVFNKPQAAKKVRSDHLTGYLSSTFNSIIRAFRPHGCARVFRPGEQYYSPEITHYNATQQELFACRRLRSGSERNNCASRRYAIFRGSGCDHQTPDTIYFSRANRFCALLFLFPVCHFLCGTQDGHQAGLSLFAAKTTNSARAIDLR